MFTAPSILFYYLLFFFFSYQSIVLYTWLLLTLFPVTILPLAAPLTFYISYQMLLTPFIWKHMYSYISENNFEHSNKIIIPTGCTVHTSCHPNLQHHNSYNRTDNYRQWNAIGFPDDGHKDARNMLRYYWLPINHYLLHLVGFSFTYT